jgi:hypothetical protein
MDPGIGMVIAQPGDLRVPVIGQRFSVETLCLGFSLASNP